MNRSGFPAILRRLLPVLVVTLGIADVVRGDDLADLKAQLEVQKQLIEQQGKALAEMKARLDAGQKAVPNDKPGAATPAGPLVPLQKGGEPVKIDGVKDGKASDGAASGQEKPDNGGGAAGPADPATPPAPAKPATPITPPELPVEVGTDLTFKTFWNNGFTAQTSDGAFRMHFGGRFDFDTGWYSVPQNVHDDDGFPGLEQGSDFRRARLRADGTLWEQMDFAFEVDFSRNNDFSKLSATPNSAVNFTDVWVQYHDLPVVGTVRIGHQKELLSFYNATSASFLPFMERPYIYDAFEDDYQYDNGVTITNTYFDKMLYVWGGLFQTGNKSGAFYSEGTAKLAVDARICVMPIYDEGHQAWMNFGIAISERANPNDPTTGLPANRFTVRPLIRTGSNTETPNLIDTGTFYTRDGTQLASACYNQAWGPLAVGAQYEFQYDANSYTGGLPSANGTLAKGVTRLGNLYFDGFYAEALVFLTHGDHHDVVRDNPGYARVVPVENFWSLHDHGGLGAWEVGLRYDHVNVNDGIEGLIGKGGELDSITLSLNWYWNPNARVTTEYVYTTGYFGSVALTDGAFHSLGMRFHFDW